MEKILALIQENLTYLDIRMSGAMNYQILLITVSIALGLFMIIACAKMIITVIANGRTPSDVEGVPLTVGVLVGIGFLLFAVNKFSELVVMMGLGKFYFLIK